MFKSWLKHNFTNMYATQNVRPRTEKSNCGLDDP